MGPTGFTTVTKSMDARTGGTWRFVMRGAPGEFANRVVYLEVSRPERLVYAHGSDVDDAPDRFHVTVTFEALGDKTHLTMRSVFPTAGAREMVVKQYKAIEGGHQTLERLERYLVAQI